VLRYPKTPLGADIPALRSVGGIDVLAEPAEGPVDVLLVSVGAMAPDVLSAAARIGEAGYTVRVIDPRWVSPVPAALAGFADQAGVLITVEDGVVVNGAGSRFAGFLAEQGKTVPTREIGIPLAFLDHGKVAEVRAGIGLTPQGISRRAVEFAAAVLGRGESQAAGETELTAARRPPAQDTDRRD
jgi:1-deoxy-D-xylulose-5-phosphate synthase